MGAPLLFKAMTKDQRGQGLTEYITLLVLISLVSVAAVKTVGSRLRAKLETAQKRIHEQIAFD
ncbi:MAG: Flp family type IVb pilin [Bdellovibrionia bacterium]